MSKDQHLTKKERYELRKQEKQAAKQKIQQQQKNKNIIIWGLVGVVVIGLLAFLLTRKPQPQADPFSITFNDHVLGEATATAQLVIFTDFECPACAAYNEVVNQVHDMYPNSVRVLYRNFPLISIHKQAIPAARAAEAAGLQDKYFEMKNLLYKNQSVWTESNNPYAKFVEYAQELGLDANKFETAYKSNEVGDKIDAERKMALRLNLRGTPSFFLNGEKIDNPAGFEGFTQLLDEIGVVKEASASAKQ